MVHARMVTRIQVSKMYMVVKEDRTKEKVVGAEKEGVLCSFQQELRQCLSGHEMLADD